MKKIFLFCLLVISIDAFAGEDACKPKVWYGDTLQLQTGEFPKTKECFVVVSQRNPKDLIYRNFTFLSNGMIMAFNSFGPGPSSVTTGARIHFLFPYRNSLQWNFEGDNLLIRLVSGDTARFDLNDGQWKDLSQAELKIDPKVHPDNAGGIEIDYLNGFVLDAGFQLGNSPLWNLKRKSLVRGREGRTCEVFNGKFFKKDGDEVYMRTRTNEGIKKLLGGLCKDLKF